MRAGESSSQALGHSSLLHIYRASHLGQCLHVDNVDEAEKEGHLSGHL